MKCKCGAELTEIAHVPDDRPPEYGAAILWVCPDQEEEECELKV